MVHRIHLQLLIICNSSHEFQTEKHIHIQVIAYDEKKKKKVEINLYVGFNITDFLTTFITWLWNLIFSLS